MSTGQTGGHGRRRLVVMLLLILFMAYLQELQRLQCGQRSKGDEPDKKAEIKTESMKLLEHVRQPRRLAPCHDRRTGDSFFQLFFLKGWHVQFTLIGTGWRYSGGLMGGADRAGNL